MRPLIAVVVGFMAAAVVAAAARYDAHDAAGGLPTPMVGAWAGEARIVVNWTTERTLRVALTITADGAVTGTVGDAVLRNGRFRRNRTAIGRALHLKTDWIIAGGLDGDVIKAEGIRRDSVTIPLDWIDDRFEGGVNTSGSVFGGRDSMWLAAQGLRLERRR